MKTLLRLSLFLLFLVSSPAIQKITAGTSSSSGPDAYLITYGPAPAWSFGGHIIIDFAFGNAGEGQMRTNVVCQNTQDIFDPVLGPSQSYETILESRTGEYWTFNVDFSGSSPMVLVANWK